MVENSLAHFTRLMLLHYLVKVETAKVTVNTNSAVNVSIGQCNGTQSVSSSMNAVVAKHSKSLMELCACHMRLLIPRGREGETCRLHVTDCG